MLSFENGPFGLVHSEAVASAESLVNVFPLSAVANLD